MDRRSPNPGLEGPSSPSSRGLTAVVCEDDRAVRRAVVAALHGARFDVVATTERGFEAVRLVGELAPTLLVLDLALSGSLGIRIIPTVKAADPDVAVIAVTTFGRLAEAILGAGAMGVVSPWDLRELEPMLATVAATHNGPN